MEEPPERKAVLRKIVHPETDEVLDEGVVLYFPRECGSVRLELLSNALLLTRGMRELRAQDILR